MIRKILALKVSIVFLIFSLSTTGQKPVVIHEVTDAQTTSPKNHNINPTPLGGSCWQALDAQFVNIDDDLYGNQGYSSANPLDDGSYGLVELGWTFTFYGQTYTSLYINVNGNVTFGNLHSAYSAQGFPSSRVPAMIAPFWGDVDLRGTGTGANKMYVKQEAGKISIQWVEVGYYNKKTNLTNTFQLILTDGTDPEIGIGNNAMFVYDDMNWCVGDASGGTNGFGNTVYATVGAQSEGGADFYQIGLFGKDNSDYDGAGGNLDGVHYLDGRCFKMDLSQNNIPPIANNLPNNRKIELCPGMMYSLNTSFSAPEVSQSTITNVTNTTLSDFSYTTTSGNLSEQTITINPSIGDTGTHIIVYEAIDDGTPAATTMDTLYVYVYDCGSEGSSASLNFDGVDDYSVVYHHPALYSGGTNTYSAWIKPETQNSNDPITLMEKDGQFKLGINGENNTPFANIIISDQEYSVTSSVNAIVDEWTHICAVAEPNSLKIYVNGELTGTETIPGSIDVSNKPLFVGGSDVSPAYYKGRLDELSLISKACNQAEVKQLRWELSSIDSDYIRAYFKCNSDVVLVNSMNSYHGTLVNMTDEYKWKNNYGKIWSGASSSNFSSPQNWVEGLPPIISSSGGLEKDYFVIFDKIGNEGSQLVLSEEVEANSVVFTQNNNSTITTDGQLKLYEDMYTYKSPNLSGEIAFIGSENQSIYGTNNFQDLKIDNDVLLLSDQNVNGNLTLNTGVLTTTNVDLTITSTENGSGQVFHNSGSIEGNVTMQRRLIYDTNSLGWHYISSPMENLKISDLEQDLQIIGLGTSVESNPFPSLYYYDETVVDQDFLKGWKPPTSSESGFDNFTGYIYYKYRKEEQMLSLTGEVFNGEKSKFLTNTSSGDPNADGWNLLGNPYPSAMNWDQIDIPSSMDNAMYIYDNVADIYKVYVDGVGINNATNIIPTMTSYFVHVNSSVMFTIDNDSRVANSSYAHYQTIEEPQFMLSMELSTGSSKDQTIIRTRQGATIKFDSKYDAFKIKSSTGNNIFSTLNQQDLSINSVGEIEDSVIVPVSLTAKNGDFSIKIKTSSAWSNMYEVFLVSKYNRYELDEDMVFNIYSNDDISTDYDVIIKPRQQMTTSVQALEDGGHKIWNNNGEIMLLGDHNFESFQLFSIEGKLLKSGVITLDNNTIIKSLNDLTSHNFLILNLISSGGIKTEFVYTK